MKETALNLFGPLFTLFIFVNCQSDKKSENRCREEDIPHYAAYKITDTLTIDGKLDENIWKNASRSNRFRDLVSGDSTWLDTRAAVLWDDQNLYVGYWIEEPDLRAQHTQRDAGLGRRSDRTRRLARQLEGVRKSFATVNGSVVSTSYRYERANNHD